MGNRQKQGLISLSLGWSALALLSGPGPALAADTRWTGAVDGNWATAGNWDAGVPTALLRAILPNGVSAALSLPAAAQAMQLLVEAAGSTIGGGSGSALTLGDNFYIDGTAASLLVNTLAAIISPNATLGLSSGNSGNQLRLDGSGVSLSIAGTFNVGYDGSLNQLRVTNGSTLTPASLWIGGLSSATGSGATVEKLNSSVTASSSVIVGYGGQISGLQVLNSASLSTPVLTLGLQGSSTGNTLTIQGKDTPGGSPASQVSVTNELNVGHAGGSNVLEVLADGVLSKSGGGDLTIGRDSSSDDNQVEVRGSLTQSGGTLIVGLNSDRNTLRIDAGGQVSSGNARIGRNAGSDDNAVTIADTGSSWTAAGSMRVGESGSGNSLTVGNGGAFTISTGSSLFVGYGNGSNNNTLKVTGSGSTLTMTTSGSEVVLGRTTGTNNRLVLSDGGSANVLAIKTGPGGVLQIGEGGGPGSLVSTATVTGNDGGLSFGGGAVLFNHNGANLNIGNTLAGPLRVEQNGSGKTTLTGSGHTYTGKTEVKAGTLALSGSSNTIGSSPAIEVSSGASFDGSGISGGLALATGQTLAGSGSVLGNLSAPSGSTIAPGLAGLGTLTFQNNLNVAGTVAIELNGSLSDRFVAAALQLDPGSTLAFTSLAAPSGGSLSLATYSSLGGTFSTVTGLPTGYALDYAFQGNQIALVRTPDSVPAPLPIAGGLAAWRWGRRLRRRLGRTHL